MIDKIKKIFENKEKRIENLISLLIILVITLIVINKILDTGGNNVNSEKESFDIRVENTRLKEENEILKQKMDALLKFIKDHKEE